MANLIICCDGTWNNPEQEDNGIPAPTNVYKLSNAIASLDANGEKQRIFYHPGLGGEDSGIKDAIADGALGVSIKRHISGAYAWVAEHYSKDDNVYVFGFSRGAFTARSLCGLLKTGLLDFSGLSDAVKWQRTHDVYDHYKKVGEAISPIISSIMPCPFRCIFWGFGTLLAHWAFPTISHF
jgi:uncharacterized protein (DUF2235 family)